MTKDYLSEMNTYIGNHASVIDPGSIEETSLLTAATMMSQGQGQVAQQIVESLLIGDDIKQACLEILSGSVVSDSYIKNPEDNPAPVLASPPMDMTSAVLGVHHDKLTPHDSVSVSRPLVRMSTPPPPPVPLVQVDQPDNNMILEIDNQHDDTTAMFGLDVQSNIVNSYTAPPVPVSPVTIKVPESTPLPLHTITTKSPQSGSKDASTEDDIWSRFNSILDEEKNKPSDGGPSHLARVEQLSGALENAGDIVEQQQDKEIPQEYDRVFGGNAHMRQFQVPGIIKTYAPAQSTIDLEERKQQANLKNRLDVYKKYFDAAEQYLTRAYASTNTDIIASAQAQFESLQNRYPEYVQERSAHIVDMQKIIDTHNQKRAETIMHDVFQLNDDMAIAPGMRISGEQDTYVITHITEPTLENGVMIMFIGDTSKELYQVPADNLATALVDVDLHTDDFFKEFLKEN